MRDGEHKTPQTRQAAYEPFLSIHFVRRLGALRSIAARRTSDSARCVRSWEKGRDVSRARSVGRRTHNGTLGANTLDAIAAFAEHELILFDDHADLYCVYQQIIGSRLIAQLDLDSLPFCIKEVDAEA